MFGYVSFIQKQTIQLLMEDGQEYLSLTFIGKDI